MKKIVLFSLTAIFSMALVGCDTTSNTNVKVNGNKVAPNTAVVVNTTPNVNTNTNKELTREDFDKDKAKYETEAKDEKSTIGKGANDLWLWTKVRSVLATVDELRDSTINVDVENDVVTLKGTVGSKAEQEAAVKAAKSVDGVKNVKDMLKVDAKDSMTNQATSDSDKDGKATTNKK